MTAVLPAPTTTHTDDDHNATAVRPPTTSTSSTTAHLSDADVEDLGVELDALRQSVMSDLGDEDAAYIRRVVAVQRGLEAGGRTLLLVSPLPPAWLAGTAALSVAKILENMEIGHNVLHGQWDWMNDPEIHSSTWEWDSASSAEGWKYTHNFVHHTYTNVLGKDRDVGYAVLRVSPEQPWRPHHLVQLGTNAALALGFEYGIAVYDIELEEVAAGRKPWAQARSELRGLWRKIRGQLAKDYIRWPLLSGLAAPTTLAANLTANIARNVWTHAVIFCGHFPAGAEVFGEDQLDGETRGQWYLRQLLGSANLDGPPLLHLMTGNLSHQIEHHLFPDMPSRRYAQVAPAVRDICTRYGLPYTSGSLPRQYAGVLATIARMSLPGGTASDTAA
ncbi:stearoyl-CoA 9-desaturase [Actinomycetospora sp. NBRC 106375]|uniref:fatty acid desaturase family protein n=1 Tax=Actinomycetospora sp. NBRC 106375 TaxID=3032207 RepID=UPI0024A057E4|nr:acyl-CoA desaturase [Actinomycetospora sp. NBRC 106375]GLZ48943.1 stearoyl-CoA 9-desaturase [Actinomycetospora sp. NBRC 106375]